MAKKNEQPFATVYPGGLRDEFPNGPPTTIVQHRGLALVFRFDKGDIAGKGPVREIWLRPDTQPLEPGVLRLMPDTAFYVNHVRKAMAIMGSDEGTTEERYEAFFKSAEPFRKVAGPGRALSPAFFQLLGEQHDAVVAMGELHPVKALADIHHVKISTASKWLKEARRRGYIEEADDDG